MPSELAVMYSADHLYLQQVFDLLLGQDQHRECKDRWLTTRLAYDKRTMECISGHLFCLLQCLRTHKQRTIEEIPPQQVHPNNVSHTSNFLDCY